MAVRARTRGLSPKVVYDLIVTVVAALLLAVFAIDVEKDPVLWLALSKAAGVVAGMVAGPGLVEPVNPFPRVDEGTDLEHGRNG